MPRDTHRRGDPRGRPSRDPRGRPSRDPCGRPSRIQHGFVSFVRGGVPRPCGVRTDPNEAIGKPGMGDDKRRPYTRTARRRGPRRGDPRGRPSRDPRGRPSRDPRGRPSRDPRGRPSRIRHGFVSFVRGGVPRPCGSRTDPNEAIGKPGMGDDKRRPYTRTARRRGPRRGDPRGRPSRDPRGRPSRIRHGFVSFVRGGVPRPCGVRTDPNEAMGKPAWATTSVAPTPEQPGDEARVGATLAVAHPESSTASFPSYEVACHALVASRTDPNEAMGKPAWATTSVAPTPEQPGDEARVGATLAVAHPATLAVAHPESGTASFPSYEVACHALVASVPTRTRPSGNGAWATTSVAPRVPGMGMD